jgi:uncharacterized protein (TIGR02217 family)
MAFLETPRFPERIAAGMSGGPAFSTDVIVLASGQESRNANWSQSRRSFDAAIAVRTLTDFAEVERHFHAMVGRLRGFRFKDWGDFRAEFGDGDLQALNGGALLGASGNGFGVPGYQLQKLYARGALSHVRDIRKPVAGTVTVRRNGSPVTVGAGAGNITLDTVTGIVTFVADQTRSVSGHTVGAAHVVTLASAFSPNLVIGGRLWLTGVIGTAAALLNGTPLQITNVSGAAITVAVNTSGLTATGGTASFFPQPANTLDWSGEFDVPCRFDTDQLRRRVIGASGATYAVDCDSIPLIEIRV